MTISCPQLAIVMLSTNVTKIKEELCSCSECELHSVVEYTHISHWTPNVFQPVSCVFNLALCDAVYTLPLVPLAETSGIDCA